MKPTVLSHCFVVQETGWHIRVVGGFGLGDFPNVK
jgi:hypothetical protein